MAKTDRTGEYIPDVSAGLGLDDVSLDELAADSPLAERIAGEAFDLRPTVIVGLGGAGVTSARVPSLDGTASGVTQPSRGRVR